MNNLKRGYFFSKDLKKGSEISNKDIYLAFPCEDENQLNSFASFDKATLIQDVKSNSPVMNNNLLIENHFKRIVRKITRETKSILNENGYSNQNYQLIEISHHYGIQKFYDHGAVFLTLFNEEVCKKICVMQKNQKHIPHYHKVKLEFFNIIAGNLKLKVDKKDYSLNQGQNIKVIQNQIHEFYTDTFVIFEEISTNSTSSDSFYIDQNINKLDPLERKTVIENW